jgi:hypothetical protein
VPSGQRALGSRTKDVLTDVQQEKQGKPIFPPVVDLNGNYVYYESRINKVEYDYIVANKLYSKAGQRAFLLKPAPPNKIDFPKGSKATLSPGSIEIKAMWKQLGANDDPGRFYTIQAIRVDPVTKTASPRPIQFGLVGLHIVTRTKLAPNWIWSTFEHEDNAPDVCERMPRPHYNFFDPTQPLPKEGFGNRPKNNDDLDPNPKPTQIARVENNHLITAPWTLDLNATMQTHLKETVWGKYRLVSTQWPNTPSDDGLPVPPRLTNTIAETYIQKEGSCMRCHKRAGTAYTDQNGPAPSANFSYLLQSAQ